MTNYKVKIIPKALQDIENIYKYIKDEFKEIDIARKTVEILEEEILGLNKIPYRGAMRKCGEFAYKGYRQIFIKKFTIVYQIIEKNNEVIIFTVRYAKSSF